MRHAALFEFHDLQPHIDTFRDEVLTGLTQPQKYIPAKFFYDDLGSRLFDQICELPEYYPTRTETAIMQAHAQEMAALLGEHCLLIEFGSGSSQKTRILLDVLSPTTYMPIEIARDQLQRSAQSLTNAYPRLRINAVCADYTKTFSVPDWQRYAACQKSVFFPGSTIGNFTHVEAVDFLKQVATVVGHGGGMLVGVDLKKDKQILHDAYNDARGVTAAFNLNLLTRINHELGANFKLDSFRHHAFYNETVGRIEMHLMSLKDQRVTVAGCDFDFHAEETIHTENSYKYAITEFQHLAASAGFSPRQVWCDDAQLFSVHYLTTNTSNE